jgi:hypothetical protein
MNANLLTSLVVIPCILLGSLLSVAVAAPAAASRGGDRAVAGERPELNASDSFVSLQMVWYHHDPSFDSLGIVANDELYILQIAGDSERGGVSIYDARSNLIVGYAGTAAGVAVFDREGLVEITDRDRSLASLDSYGPALAALTNPEFLIQFLEMNDVVLGGDEPAGHPLAWAAAAFIARCIDASATFDGDGNLQEVTISWDC